MKKALLLIITILCAAITVRAAYTQTCKIKYRDANENWSKYYKVDVHFMNGSELNEKTSSTNYSIYSVYAVIFWDEKKVTVIKLSNMIGCYDVDHDCINGRVSNLEGKDQEDKTWQICPSGSCFL